MPDKREVVAWPKRRFTVPRSPARVVIGTIASGAAATLVGGALLFVVALIFRLHPEYATVLGWHAPHSQGEAMGLLLRGPVGWAIVAVSLFLFLLLMSVVLTAPGDLTLMPDRLVIHDGRSIVELPYWQIEHIWLSWDENKVPWLVIEGAYRRTARLPLSPSHPFYTPTRRALPHLLQRVPAWTRVSPEVTAWLKKHAQRA